MQQHSQAQYNGQGQTVSCYITYRDVSSADLCISTLDESLFDNKIIRVTYGTTKYCSYFLKNRECINDECMYLHEFKSEINHKLKLFKLHNFKPLNKGIKVLGKEKIDLSELFKYKRERNWKPERMTYSPFDF